MFKLEIDNSFSILIGINIPKEVFDICTFQYRYFYRTKKMRKAKMATKSTPFWDRISKNAIRFPSGWSGKVAALFRSLDLSLEVEDLRIPVLPCEFDSVNTPKLWKFQADSGATALKATRGIICHPTGSGKTITAANIMAKIGHRTLYAVPSIDLLNQTYDDFCEIFSKVKSNSGLPIVGHYYGNAKEFGFITIITANSLYNLVQKKEAFLDSIRVLILDEAHHVNYAANFVGANTWLSSAMYLSRCYWRFGFTATPGKEESIERRALEMATGRIIHHISYQDAVDSGHIHKPEVIMHEVNVGETRNDWQKTQDMLFRSDFRNQMIKDISLQYFNQGKRVLVLVSRVAKHGKILEGCFGDSAVFIHGSTSDKDRSSTLEDLRHNNLFIVISTISGEGVNIKNLDVVVRASGGASDKKSIQELGRVVRRSSGKKDAVLIDFYDKDFRYYGSSKQQGYLSKHSLLRKKAYEGLGFDVKIIKNGVSNNVSK